MATQIRLKVTFINKVLSPKFGNKILRQTESNHSYVYYGKTKKECNDKAKATFRFNGYKKEYSTEPITD